MWHTDGHCLWYSRWYTANSHFYLNLYSLPKLSKLAAITVSCNSKFHSLLSIVWRSMFLFVLNISSSSFWWWANILVWESPFSIYFLCTTYIFLYLSIVSLLTHPSSKVNSPQNCDVSSQKVMLSCISFLSIQALKCHFLLVVTGIPDVDLHCGLI